MWPTHGYDGKGGDIETGGVALYPMMRESPEMRWAFIRKVYMILSIQLVMTVVVASVVVANPRIAFFFAFTPAGIVCYIFVCLLPLMILCPLSCYYQRHPVNLILLALFTVSLSFAIGIACSFTKGKIVLEAAILTSVVVVSLTLYTFWAAKRGHDFSFLGPFLFASLMVLMVFGLIQMLFPLGKISVMIYGAMGAIIFSGFIVYDTDNIIKRFSYDEYIWAAISLYLDIINLFIAILQILEATED